MALTKRPRSQTAQYTVPEAEVFLGDELLAVPTTAGGTALASVPAGARHAFFQNLDTANNVIVRMTSGSLGGNPDSTHGWVIKPAGTLDLTADPALVKILAVTSAVNVYVGYFGEI